MDRESQKRIVEALVLGAPEPVSARKIAEAMGASYMPLPHADAALIEEHDVEAVKDAVIVGGGVAVVAGDGSIVDGVNCN